MTLNLQHFDTKLKQDLDVKEQISNSLAEYLFPDTEFSLGMVYKDAASFEDLTEYKGKTLQFASGERMYFANQSIRDLVYPNPSDGAAYGSIVFTPCKSFIEKKLRVLIIDDASGASGGIVPIDTAKQLVGDCYGKISYELARELVERDNTPLQFRIGIKPQPENEVYRIAKGTLAPANLNNLDQTAIARTIGGETQVKSSYDMVLATSSFKGRKGADAIQPGEYDLTLGIGIKTLAEYGKQSLGTQVLVNYPRGVEANILPELKEEAEKLAEVQGDPRQLAQHYVEQYERRQQLLDSSAVIKPNFEPDLNQLNSTIDQVLGEEDLEQEDSPEQQKQDLLLYRLLKKDLEGHSQLLEHPKVIDSLNKYVRKQWVDIATGRAIKFQAGLAQPSWDLAKDEICVPIIPAGEEVIVTRSPLVNSNGVIVLKNKHLSHANHLKGSIHINPETAAEHLQADFDGDRLAFEQVTKYPILAAEIKERNLVQNRHPDVVKKQKIAYTGTFEEIAINAMESKIGLIANQIQKAVALQWETQLISPENKETYLKQISNYYKKLTIDDANPRKALQLPSHLKQGIEKLANLPQQLNSQQIDQSLAEVKKLLFDSVSELSNELQVAVDGPKSASRPDETVLAYCKAISEYTSVGWLADKKNSEAYLNRSINSNNYSPIDLMVKQTNKFFVQSQLVARPLIEFLPLFQQVSFTQNHTTKAKEITETYNQLIKEALSLEKSVKTQSGPCLVAVSATSGKQIIVENLLKFDPASSPVWTESRLDIKLFPNSKKFLPEKLMAVVVTDKAGNSCCQPIGTVSEESVKEHNLQAGIRLTADCTLTPGATATQVRAKFKEAAQYLEKVQQQAPQTEHLPIAAALWHANHTRTEHSSGLKKASIAFNAFPDLIVSQLPSLQFTHLSVVGVHQPSNEHLGRKWYGEKVQCQMAQEGDLNSPNYGKKIIVVEGKKLAPLSAESPSLPLGTQFEAKINSPPGAAVVATTPKGNSLKITQIKNYDFANREWNGEPTRIVIGFIPNPNPSKQPTPVALLDNKILGVLDRDSAEKLKSVNLLKSGVTLTANLKSSPATVAYLQVDPDSVVYPHQIVASPSKLQPKENVSYRANQELEPKDWLAVATAIDQSPKYVAKVKQVIEGYKAGISLSERANAAMQQDFHAYKQVSQQLGQWHQSAKALDKPEAYIKKVEEVAFAFHSAATPLSQQAITTMQRDLQDYQQLTVKQTSQPSPPPLANDPVQAWQHYSQQAKADTPFTQAREVAIAALKAGVEPDDTRQILAVSPSLQKLGQRSLAENIEFVMRYAENYVKQKSRPQQPQCRQQNQQSELRL